MRTYLVVFYGAALLSLLLTPLVIRLARAVDLYDAPGVRKVHAAAIPRLGGIALVIPVMVLIVPVFFLENDIGRSFRLMQWQLIAFLGASVLVFAVGLADDIWGLKAKVKLTCEIMAAGIVVGSGVHIDGILVTNGAGIHLGWLSIPLTLIWIVGITNAVNLIDGLDGLASGISLITCTVICAVAVYMHRPVMALLMLAVIGSLLGFLFYNFNPARIFLGDGGSLFLGFVLAGSSVLTSHKTTTLVALAMPVLALGVPIFDTLFSMARRLMDRRSMFAPDREHIHHRLLKRGFEHHHVVLLLYGITVAACGLGLLMILTQDLVQLAFFLLALLFLIVSFRVSGVISLKSTLQNIRRNQALSSELRRHQNRFEAVQVALKEATSVEQWWDGLCQIAEALDFATLDVECQENQFPSMNWVSPKVAAVPDSIQSGRGIALRYTVHDEKARPVARIEAVLRRGRSFESVGQRLTLFGRLMDDHSLPRLIRRPAGVSATRST